MTDTWKKKTILFLLSQTISLFGSLLVQYAITWHITLTTKSGMMMTIAIICGFLPNAFLSPFAGVWADRYNRKTLIMLADGMIALATLVLAILYLTGHGALWLLFAASAIRSVGQAVQTPAVGAFLPQIVPQDKLTKVNGTNSSIQSTMLLVCPMLAAALLTVAKIEAIFFIDVVTAALAIAILLLFLHVPAHAKALEKQTAGYLADMRAGYDYIKNHAFVKTFCLFNAVFFILIAPAAFLTPLQVTRTFGDDVWRLTAVEVTFSIGMMAGGLLMVSWGGFANKIHTCALSNLILGACTFALGVVPNFWLYLFFMVVTGISLPIFNTPFTVLLQQKVEEAFMGRVFGVFGMIASTTMPLAMLVYGPVADHIRIEWLMAGTGLLLCIQALLLGSNKALLKAGQPVM